MKKVTIILTGVILMAISAINVNAQNTATETAEASATIHQHLSLSKDVDLAFGGIITDTDGGTVAIPATSAGTPNYNGLPAQLATTTSAAKFTASGQDGATFDITLPTSATITNGSESMIIDNFISSTGNDGVVLSGGATEFFVGATLNIAAGQAAGEYTGEFDVTVTYE
ncbi:hypothetical protein TBC1_11730 [Lentimicrobium saccharophilum]|uniref:DUF4402 domain-containing protein n=1 Tax=Lentimicrobium saccharophilum TaxID=1678841 RepID=A0A0S7C004_9BACT|nr:DUF4402 domain-containing protein [Lentimicrobium saccharophilum]GAP42598.1 hypothetical protein TBC1_11730 [Lentimicrobium saccharophilum]